MVKPQQDIDRRLSRRCHILNLPKPPYGELQHMVFRLPAWHLGVLRQKMAEVVIPGSIDNRIVSSRFQKYNFEWRSS
jgi:hypothetical protein